MGTPIINQTLLGQYRVDDFIASGGMGAVYRVWDLKRNVFLAMKVLHAELADDPHIFKRFQREANALKKLAHPNIVPFYGLFQTEAFAFLLERFIDGPSLKDILKRNLNQPLPVLEALAYLKALCAALGFAHAHQVVHCDVKPGNVMVDQGGTIYLTDFGIARHADSASTTLGVVGTPAYMAPEQIRGEMVSPATDIYALGVILFELLTGQRPFKGTESETAQGGSTQGERIRYGHLHLEAPDPCSLNLGLPQGVSRVIAKAMAKDPSERYLSTQALFETACIATGVEPETVADRARLPIIVQGEPKTHLSVNGQTDHFSNLTPLLKRRSYRAILVGVVGLIVVATFLLLVSHGSAKQSGLSTNLENTRSSLVSATHPSMGNTSLPYDAIIKETRTPVIMTPVSFLPAQTYTPFPVQTSTLENSPTPLSATSVPTYFPLEGCSASHLHIGDQGYITLGTGYNAIRDSPDLHPHNVIGKAEEGEMVNILDGPVCYLDTWVVWKVQSAGGVVGWTPETDGKTFFIIPGSNEITCTGALPTHLQVGGTAMVNPNPPYANNVRSDPSSSATLLGTIAPGEHIQILAGPVCSDQMLWWKISSLEKALQGWTSEGKGNAYWLVP